MSWTFGEFELDDELFELRRNGERVALRPQALDVLVYLVKHRDRVVTKRELDEAIWPGAKVSDAALPQAVLAVRRALNDTAEQPRVIHTVRARGYRFIASLTATITASAHASEVEVVTSGSSSSSSSSLIGRETHLARLTRAFEAASSGRSGIVLLAGGPGSGKTRIASELGAVARSRGARVITIACQQAHETPELWPWTHALRECSLHVPKQQHQQREREQRQREQQRDGLGDFRLFDDVVQQLRGAAKAVPGPLVLVFDDLEHTDPGSLLLLRFAVTTLGDARVLLVATYRDGALANDHVLARTVGALTREDPNRSLTLEGFTRAEIVRLAASILGRTPDDDLVDRVHQKSEGNPLFATQLLHLVRALGSSASITQQSTSALLSANAMRAALSLHLSELSDECRGILSRAAIFGRDFRLAHVAEMSSCAVDTVLASLDQAIHADVIEKIEGNNGENRVNRESGPSFRFVHVLVRDVLYKALSLSERAGLHEAAGKALHARGIHEAATAHLEQALRAFGRFIPMDDNNEPANERASRLLEMLHTPSP